MEQLIQFPFPIFIAKEGKWFVAECPILDIATQGKTEKEVKKNMGELIQEYIADPDTAKFNWRDISLTYIPASIPKKVLYGKA